MSWVVAHFRKAGAGLLAVGLASLSPAPAAQALRPVPSYLSDQVSDAHFVVHYTSDQSIAGGMSTADANTVLANAAQAYDWEIGRWGYPPPRNDGDGKTDIYVYDTPSFLNGAAAGGDDPNADQTTGFILANPKNAVGPYAIAHEFFHVIQDGVYQHAGFLTESTAEWAGQAVVAATGGSPPPNWYPNPQVSLDCLTRCGDSGAYRGSIFWEYLSERFGTGIAREVYERDAALAAVAGDHQPHDLQALEEALTAHGSSIADAFNGYALAAMAGRITRPGVLPNAPRADHAIPGGSFGNARADAVVVNHLALKSIAVMGADPSEGGCASATLDIEIDLPPGVPTRPFFAVYSSSDKPPATAVYPLTIQGSVARGEVPWNLCGSGRLTLPNASAAADGQTFTVHAGIVPAEKPASTRRPEISGIVQVGRRLSVSTGEWTGSEPIAYSYQWQRCKPRCANIARASGRTYTAAAGDRGARLRVVVTAANKFGSARATTDRRGPVQAGAGQIKALLARTLTPSGRQAKIADALARGGYTYSFRSLGAGRIGISWYYLPAGARLAGAHARPKPVMLATGRATFSSAKTVRVVVKLGGPGRRLLAGARILKVTAKGTYTPTGAPSVAGTRAFTLTR